MLFINCLPRLLQGTLQQPASESKPTPRNRLPCDSVNRWLCGLRQFECSSITSERWTARHFQSLHVHGYVADTLVQCELWMLTYQAANANITWYITGLELHGQSYAIQKISARQHMNSVNPFSNDEKVQWWYNHIQTWHETRQFLTQTQTHVSGKQAAIETRRTVNVLLATSQRNVWQRTHPSCPAYRINQILNINFTESTTTCHYTSIN